MYLSMHKSYVLLIHSAKISYILFENFKFYLINIICINTNIYIHTLLYVWGFLYLKILSTL